MAPPATLAVQVDEAYCKGCGLCVAFCEQAVLEISPTPNARGVYAARIVAGKICRGCRSCVLICPEAAVRLFRH